MRLLLGLVVVLAGCGGLRLDQLSAADAETYRLRQAFMKQKSDLCERECNVRAPHMPAVLYDDTTDQCRCWSPLLPSEDLARAGIPSRLQRPPVLEFPAPFVCKPATEWSVDMSDLTVRTVEVVPVK